MNKSAPRAGDTAIPVGERVGSFRYLRAEHRWEWSDAVAHMHGYATGQVQPTTALVMSHNHPDDAANMTRLIGAMTRKGKPLSSRHRIIDTPGPHPFGGRDRRAAVRWRGQGDRKPGPVWPKAF